MSSVSFYLLLTPFIYKVSGTYELTYDYGLTKHVVTTPSQSVFITGRPTRRDDVGLCISFYVLLRRDDAEVFIKYNNFFFGGRAHSVPPPFFRLLVFLLLVFASLFFFLRFHKTAKMFGRLQKSYYLCSDEKRIW